MGETGAVIEGVQQAVLQSEQKKGHASVGIDPSPQRDRQKRNYVRSQAGRIACGTYGAELVPCGFRRYYAGGVKSKWVLDIEAFLEQMKHITTERLVVDFYVASCPDSAVWQSADQFASQRLDRFGSELLKIPSGNFGSAHRTVSYPSGQARNFRSTTFWRNTIASHYNAVYALNATRNFLPYRQYELIWWDCFADKESQDRPVFHTINYPQEEEVNYYLGGHRGLSAGGTTTPAVLKQRQNGGYLRRVSADKQYLNDFRNQVVSDNSPVDNTSLFSHHVTQEEFDEYRQRAENANKTIPEIIADLRGSKMALENSPQVIGHTRININNDIQPQSAESSFSMPLGAQGAISYTPKRVEIDLSSPDGGAFSHPKDGYLHCFLVLRMPDASAYINSVPFELLQSNANDFYRKGLRVLRDRAMNLEEISGYNVGPSIVGYAPRFGEILREPNVVSGDFYTTTPSRLREQPILFNPRPDSAGYYSQDPANPNGSIVRLPSRSDYLGLLTPAEAPSFSFARVDHTDTSLRRVLMNDGGSLSTIDYKSQSMMPFFMAGTYYTVGTEPIDEQIIRNHISNGGG